ncbi:juvenile hormone epoxide hydrolase-like [Spodoptera frugiperda]|uniref:Epoxide hydrolase n=1 Tax=Spodoptera frugiperda TaxID=7108 RepID=A0A9R0DI75_SPOFR|nr:juvenile hormone epoxide hydrolase-like [Spodoptera frugiperda]
MARLLFIAPILALAIMPVYFLFLKGPPPLPELDMNEWWGPEKLKEKPDTSIKPFKIAFGDTIVKDLKDRLKRSRSFTAPLEGVAFQYGFNTAQLDGWLKYWANDYKFKERETFLNQYPQFKTNIQGLDIHFIRVTPKVPAGVEVVPMLLLHGWPGSVREFYEAIPLITAVSKDRDFAVEVIVPSLPGYGFSDAAVRPGLGAPQMAVVMKNLMSRLGYKKFYVQGGDWGSMIGSNLATLFPEDILGFHTNFAMTMTPVATLMELIGSVYPPLVVEEHLADRMYPLNKRFSHLLEESGYMHIQSSKPDTVGVGLSDSPAGLLAYILEKFSTWTRPDHREQPDGGLAFRFSKDQLLDNLMFYWAPGSITSSMRLYSENFNSKVMGMKLDYIPTTAPVWVTQAKYELAYQPPFLIKLKFSNLVGVTVLDDGGHFLAFELPKVFAEDVLKAIGEFRKIAKKNVKTDL